LRCRGSRVIPGCDRHLSVIRQVSGAKYAPALQQNAAKNGAGICIIVLFSCAGFFVQAVVLGGLEGLSGRKTAPALHGSAMAR